MSVPRSTPPAGPAPADFASPRLDLPATARRLVALRWWALALLGGAVLAAPGLLAIDLPEAPMLAVLAVAAAWNGLSGRRLATLPEITDAEFLGQLGVDLVAFGTLLFFSGGASNPLVSLLLLPVVVAALTLPRGHAAAIAALAIGIYTLLMWVSVPLPIANPERATQLHLSGMWLTFVFSALLLGGIVLRMTLAIRERDAALAAAREQALRDERVLALGTLAAGAAHELGSPLGTMALLVGELRDEPALSAQAREDLDLLAAQIGHCKRVIGGLTERAGAARAGDGRPRPCAEWLAAVHAGWMALRGSVDSRIETIDTSADASTGGHDGRPADGLKVSPGGTAPATIRPDPTLEQGIVNLLDNAARAGPPVLLRHACADGVLRIEIADHGPGFAAEVLAADARHPLPAHAHGSGIGLMLTRAAIERLGGRLTLSNPTGGGALARIDLPLARP